MQANGYLLPWVTIHSLGDFSWPKMGVILSFQVGSHAECEKLKVPPLSTYMVVLNPYILYTLYPYTCIPLYPYALIPFIPYTLTPLYPYT